MRLAWVLSTIDRREKAKWRFDPDALQFANNTAHTKVKFPKCFTWNRIVMSKLVTYIGILITYSIQFSS